MRRALHISCFLCAALALSYPVLAIAQDGGAWGSGDSSDDTGGDAAGDAGDEGDADDDDAGDSGGGAWGGGESADDGDDTGDTSDDDAGDAADDGGDDDAKDDDAKDDDAKDDDAKDDGDGDGGDGDGSTAKKLKRDGKDAKDARKKAMAALSAKHPSKDGGGATPIVPTPPPIIREATETLPRIEHHGYLRTRLDLFSNLDLDTKGSSPIAPPLDSSERGESTQLNVEPTDAETLAGGNMRFRYAPVIHITEQLRIHAMVDLLDNYVLGSTPDGLRGGRTDVPIIGLTGSSEDPSLANVGRDAFSVRSAYGEADTLLGTIRAGRMPSDWGLGMLANDGGTYSRLRQMLSEEAWSCIDCNHGDYIDRIEIVTQIPFIDFFHVQFSWDFVSEGLVGYDGQTTAYGQAFDLAQADDVIQFVLAVFDKPVDKQSAEERRKDFDAEKPVFNWGVYFVYRDQEADLQDPVDASTLNGNASTAQLEFRNLVTAIPDVWAELAWKFGQKRHLKVSAEVAAVIGSIEQVDVGDTAGRDIFQLGGALETEIRISDGYLGLNTGFASGNENIGLGYQDVPSTGDPSILQVANTMNSFHFDRNYFVDLIMFRELVGGVTNAVYFDAWGEYQFPVGAADSPTILGARLDAITAFAPRPEATPGNEAWYGFETDLEVYYMETDRLLMNLQGGVFIPGGAWNRVAGRQYPILPDPAIYPDHLVIQNDIEAAVAWTIQANLWWLF